MTLLQLCLLSVLLVATAAEDDDEWDTLPATANITSGAQPQSQSPQAIGQCEPLRIDICSDQSHNLTSYPNPLMNHTTQDEAAQVANQWSPLVAIGCSEHLNRFICLMYAPPCDPGHPQRGELDYTPLPPCRHLCESARNGCAPLMEMNGYAWPDPMNCTLFPESPTNTAPGTQAPICHQ